MDAPNNIDLPNRIQSINSVREILPMEEIFHKAHTRYSTLEDSDNNLNVLNQKSKEDIIIVDDSEEENSLHSDQDFMQNFIAEINAQGKPSNSFQIISITNEIPKFFQKINVKSF